VVNIFIFDLDASGMPTTTLLYSASNVPSTKLAWNTHVFPTPVNAPNGFHITLAGPQQFLSIGTTTATAEWPFSPNTHFYTSDYTQYDYSTFESAGFSVNPMIRAKGFGGAKFGYAEKGSEVSQGEPLTYIESATSVVTDDPYPQTKAGGTRGVVGYKLWRLKVGQETNPAVWTQLTSNPVPAMKYTDITWPTAAEGKYRWAVRTCYHGGVESDPQISKDTITKKVAVPYTISITTNTGEFPTGAVVTLKDTTNYYTQVSPSTGLTVFPKVFCGKYALQVTLSGFDTIKLNITVTEAGGTTAVLLVETINDPTKPEVDFTACDGAKFTWSHVAEKPFLGFTIYLNDKEVATGIQNTQYLFTNLPDGTYTAGVQANYISGVSKIVKTEKFDIPCTGIIDLEKGDFRLYPVPADNKLYVQRSGDALAYIEIFNPMGMFIAKYETTSSTYDINVTALSAGTYFVKLTEGDKTTVKSFVKK